MRKLTTEEFIEKAKKIHGNKYDYSLAEYKNYKTKIKIICFVHGIFEQRAGDHLHNKGCQKCYDERRGKTKLLTTEEFIEKAKKIHGNKYDYSKSIFINTRTKIEIICPIHGVFKQKANGHLNGKGCSKCNSSKGEIEVRKFLTSNNIIFEEQKRFKDCKNKKALPFDFYIPNINTCIEFQGRQHYEPVSAFGGEIGLAKRRENDLIKKEYCQRNNISLIEIREEDSIDDVLISIISKGNIVRSH